MSINYEKNGGFKFEEVNGGYEVYFGKGYTREREQIELITDFAKLYWGQQKEITFYMDDRVNLEQAMKDLRGMMLNWGAFMFIPRGQEGVTGTIEEFERIQKVVNNATDSSHIRILNGLENY